VYPHWRDCFYPRGLPSREWFQYYAERYDTVEINNTFYHLPEARTFDAWREQAPEGFCFALKFSRYGSHLKHLRDAHESIGRFFERALRLERHLGPVLLQLPPRWHIDADRLAAFLGASPAEARWAVEFRDPSWLCETVYEVLRAHNAALCIHDMIEDHPREVTANWLYLRFHGQGYRGCYSPQRLTAEARRIREYLRRRLDVFAYFNNDLGGHAVSNAADLRRYATGPRGRRVSAPRGSGRGRGSAAGEFPG
jgi:uncharacterized protein YecE (DUF72 family)